MKMRLVRLAAVIALAVPVAAFAQPPCSIHTITGTYAVQITGQSLIGALVPNAAPYQLVGGEAALVARLTIAPDGSVSGPLWGVYVAETVEGDFAAQVSV